MGDPVEDGPERIDLANCAMLLGKSRPLLSVWSTAGKFALPAGIRDGRPFWHEDDVYQGADNAAGASAGLEQLTQIDWPHGTVFTRAQLEAA